MSLSGILNRKLSGVVDGSETPPIFADVVLDMSPDPMLRINVEKPGWRDATIRLFNQAQRVGLVMREEDRVRVWVATENGTPVRYFSRVIGQIGVGGHKRWRVAALQSSGACVWLHRDGLVEVGQEPQREI